MGVLGGILRIAGGIAQGTAAAGSVAQGGASMFPRLEDEVTVEVKGQPGATKRDLYYLALATASGLVRRFDGGGLVNLVPPAPGALMIEYDAADNWVRCTLRYNTNMLVAYSSDGRVLQAPVYKGPAETAFGANFNFTSNFLPGLIAPEFATKVVPLPWTGRNIVTSGSKCFDPAPGLPGTASTAVIDSPNPKPTGDNRSRGTVSSTPKALGTFPTDASAGTSTPQWNDFLVPLVFAALTGPNSTAGATTTPPVPGVFGG